MRSIRLFIIIISVVILHLSASFIIAGTGAKYVLKGIDLNGVNQDKQEQILSILKRYNCPCGCKKGDLVTCRNSDDENCSVSRNMAVLVRDKVLAGEDEEAISKIVEKELNKIKERKRKKDKQYEKVYDINTDGAHFMGKENAKLSLIVFLDYECPYCTRGYKLYKQLVNLYPDDLRFVFMHNPLDMHKHAVDLAAAAEAAAEQGKFFQMTDLLMENKGKYSEEKVLKFAEQIGLDLKKFKKDLIDVDVLTRVFFGKEEAKLNHITATPTIILNNKKIMNKNNLDYYKNIIQKELGEIK